MSQGHTYTQHAYSVHGPRFIVFIWPRPWIEKSEDEVEKKLVFLLFSLSGWMDGYSRGNINEKNVLSFSTCSFAAAQHMPYQVACQASRKKRRTRKENWNLFLLIKLDWFFYLATFFSWNDALLLLCTKFIYFFKDIWMDEIKENLNL